MALLCISISSSYLIQVREQARHLDAQLARVQERQHRIETTLSLAPKVNASGIILQYNMYLVCQYLHTTYEYAGPTEHSGEVFCYETVLCHPRMPLLRWRLHNEDDDVPTLAYFPEI